MQVRCLHTDSMATKPTTKFGVLASDGTLAGFPVSFGYLNLAWEINIKTYQR